MRHLKKCAFIKKKKTVEGQSIFLLLPNSTSQKSGPIHYEQDNIITLWSTAAEKIDTITCIKLLKLWLLETTVGFQGGHVKCQKFWWK